MVTKASGNDHRAHTGVFLTRVPGAGFPTGSASRDAPRGWLTQEGLFGRAPAHGPSFPIPPGAAGVTEPAVSQPCCGYRGHSLGRSLPPCVFSLHVRSRRAPWPGGWSIPLDYTAPAARSGKAVFALQTPMREKITSYSKREAFLSMRRGG